MNLQHLSSRNLGFQKEIRHFTQNNQSSNSEFFLQSQPKLDDTGICAPRGLTEIPLSPYLQLSPLVKKTFGKQINENDFNTGII